MEEWQGYISKLVDSKSATQVGIFGLDGESLCTSSAYPTKLPIKTVIAGLKDTQIAIKNKFLNDGRLNYMLLSTNGAYNVYKSGSCGFVACKTTKGFVIALFDDKIKSSTTIKTVQEVANLIK